MIIHQTKRRNSILNRKKYTKQRKIADLLLFWGLAVAAGAVIVLFLVGLAL